MEKEDFEVYCPYEKNVLNEYCESCKKGKIPFRYIGSQKSLKEKISHKYNCPEEFTFSREKLEEYNKNRK
jgi:hypothetical protein